MVFGLEKLFGKKSAEPTAPLPAAAEASTEATRSVSAFLRRDAVFDREHKLAGHLIRLQHFDEGLGNAATKRQRSIDDALLNSL